MKVKAIAIDNKMRNNTKDTNLKLKKLLKESNAIRKRRKKRSAIGNYYTK